MLTSTARIHFPVSLTLEIEFIHSEIQVKKALPLLHMYHSRVLFLIITATLREWQLAGLQLKEKDESQKKKRKNHTRWLPLHSEAWLIPPCRHINSLVLLAVAKPGLLRRENSCLGRQKSKQESSPSEGKRRLQSPGEGWQGAKARASASGKPSHPGNQRGEKEPSLRAAEKGGEG